MELGEGLKKILLVGIGTAAVTAEKSKEILDELVKKGELTVEQGKVLNQELKHNIKSTGSGPAAGGGIPRRPVPLQRGCSGSHPPHTDGWHPRRGLHPSAVPPWHPVPAARRGP